MEKLVREDRPVTVHGKTDIRSPIGMSEAGRHDAEKIKELFERPCFGSASSKKKTNTFIRINARVTTGTERLGTES